jgi:hypothetical protein
LPARSIKRAAVVGQGAVAAHRDFPLENEGF